MNKELIYDPFYQRNFVWSPIHQKEFIKTIILGYTCPEIFIAEGELDLETHIKYIHVIDGQQRLRTIDSYFGNKLEVDGKKFKDLSEDEIVEATEDVVKMKGKLYKIFNNSINLFFLYKFS
ncbi:hypothetical protein CLOACE_21410 [Clostridium acetireducens DSM 10703]|uniref:GmrSD restriction endonucleases N-terminal domain-containing protein n=1 Tax=Clostridium acetireducens DSM 10703 TaxID=1121290 RepID=A0A1E8EW89_9CLOT|nr:DUF262 domain-containing protein [Clostridium acetireducens]OFI01416.1 hypothetical protein CLOACE_21410 [Clostridium acetireducens DSM 10703]